MKKIIRLTEQDLARIVRRVIKEEETNELALESFDEKRRKFVYLWSLIPLTRAIDTLVITIKNKESDVCKYLRKTYERYPDFIQWIE